jgi:hypothetical protein
MTAGNFNWLLHTMLFHHTQRVIQGQENRGQGNVNEEDENSDGEE